MKDRSTKPVSFAALACLAVGATAPGAQDASPLPPTDEMMVQLHAEYGDKEKKYDSLAKKIRKDVDKAFKAWSDAGVTGTDKNLSEHPFFLLVDGLSSAAQDAAKKKNPRVEECLEQYPWVSQLELVTGIQYGSDRAIPDHTNGFIHLGAAPDPLPGFPELSTNHYLYGLREVIGWRFAVGAKRDPTFEGRTAKNKASLETSLSGWEGVRVYLEGSLPEVPLFAMPQLTHRIHAWLAQRRSADAQGEPPMDGMLAFLDSKWNGFTFEPPYSKRHVAFIVSPHALFTDTKGFVYRFPPSAQLASVGDIPFVSTPTYVEYGKHFRNLDLTPGDFISMTPQAKSTMDQFVADSTYLRRYKTVIDVIVRAVLAPNVRYPDFLKYLDYREGKSPKERERDSAFDVPRKHAILLWAYAEKDPRRVADFLYDNLFKPNPFPSDASLPGMFTQVVREKEEEMLESIAARMANLRGQLGGPGELEREFSPHATYLDPGTETASDYLLESHWRFNEPTSEVIRQIAHSAVRKEIE